MLQLKATESVDYVREAIASHPDIDVVVPHELYEKMADHHDFLGHILDGHETLQQVNGHVGDAVGHAEAAGATHLPVVGPVLVIGFAAALNYRNYRQGKSTSAEALRDVGQRGVLAILASGTGWAVSLLAHEPFVGLPTSVTVRLFGGQFLHNHRRRELMAQYVETVKDSRRHLERQLQRPLLQAVTE